MFISNKEKSDINENITRNKSQLENVVKHVAKLQVDMSSSELPKIAEIKATVRQVQKMCWGAKDEMKMMQEQLNMLREINDLIIERVSKMELLARARAQITIPKEKVQQMKDEGTWDDLEKRGPLLVTFIKEKRLEDEKKAKRSAYGKKYYANKKAKQASQQSLI